MRKHQYTYSCLSEGVRFGRVQTDSPYMDQNLQENNDKWT